MNNSNRYAVIEAGKVANIIVSSRLLDGMEMVLASDCRIGDLWDGETFTQPQVLPPTVEAVTVAVQAWLDSQAQSKGYDNMLSAASYATSINPKFGPEGVAARDARDAAWAYCYAQFAAIEDGQREPPLTIDAFIAELTPVQWP